MHVMFNYYLPPRASTPSSGVFGAAKSGFSGPLRVVKDFAALTAGPGADGRHRRGQARSQQMQQQFDVRVDTEAKAAGATPIRVRLPIDGKLFKLEKILALPEEKLFFELQYQNW